MTTAPRETVHIALGDRSYDIHVGADLLSHVGELLKPILRRPKTVTITDENVAELYLDRLVSNLESGGISNTSFVLPAGEQTKSFAALEKLTGDLLESGVERNDTLIALGGGVIGDLVGFASAILRRGVDFAQIPTTLLSQVDSSVGGKTGINTPQGKNLVGAFHQPRLVISDLEALATLPKREFLSGYCEVLKYALIQDQPFFEWLEANGDALKAGNSIALLHAVKTSCEAKAEIVQADERESGRRALLNLGHTFGHALEAATGYGKDLTHGEAVGIGLHLAFGLSHELGLCDQAAVARVQSHLTRMGLRTSISEIQGYNLDADVLLHHMSQDKKVVDGKLTFILVRGIGEAFVSRDVPQDKLKRFLAKTVQS